MAKDEKKGVFDKNSAYILQAGTPVFVKTADICAMTGKSNQWIGQLTSQGTLNKTKTKHGSLYELAPNIKAYCDMLENRAEERCDDPDIQELELEKRRAEVKAKKAKATMLDYELKELKGKMHRSEDVASMTADLLYSVRNSLIALPGRLAMDLSSLTEPAEISARIQKEVYLIMEELSSYKYDPEKYKERVMERSGHELSMEDTDDE
ncbi:MAG: protoporphyrinogen oxidase [Clostridia bacterium]|nr:protoporphyrinogen oxidase [Clostridia bacterium]